MPFKDILLHLDTYPDPAPLETVDQAVALCAQLGASATAMAIHVQIPLKTNQLAEWALNLRDLAREEEQRSLENAKALLAQFEHQCAAHGLRGTSRLVRADLYAASDRVAESARAYDLSVIPYGVGHGPQTALAETVIFGSGRPVVVFRPTPGRAADNALSKIVIAWDGSRSAARAVADAMPLLTAANEVRVMTILNEKPNVTPGLAADLCRNLAAHGVAAIVDEVDAGGAPIGMVIGEHVAVQQADLLVMGAFGHSRLREFVLGGATQSLVNEPPVPVLFSH